MRFLVKLFGKNYIKKTPEQEIIKFPALEQKLLDYYKIILECSNCTSDTTFYIKKGVKYNDIVTSISCNNCGCRLEKI